MGAPAAPPPGDYQSNPQAWTQFLQSNPLLAMNGQNATDPNIRAAAGAYQQDQQKQWNAQHQGGSKKAAPPPPDYTGAATGAADISRQNVATQTQQNRPTINSPFQTQSWTTGPDGSPVLTQGLAGGLGQGASSLENQFAQANANPLDPSLFGPVAGGDAARNQAIQSAWGQSTSRLDPMWDQKQTQLQSTLAAQGLDPNSEAYRNATSQFGRDRNDAYTSALNAAIGQGTTAGQAVFGENLQAHQQALSDALAQRNAPLQSLGTLQGFTQTPQFSQAGLAETPQLLPAAMAMGNYGLQNQQMQNQAWANLFGGLTGLLGGAASFIPK